MSEPLNFDTEPLPEPAARRIDQVCNQFEAAWKAGTGPRVEDALGQAPEPARSALLRELVVLEAYYRRLRGEECRAEEYQSRFPALDSAWLAAELAEQDHGGRESTWPVESVESPKARRAQPPERASDTSAEPTGGGCAGRRYGDYVVLAEIARGGMGVVYKARQLSLNRTVALKMIRDGAMASSAEVRRLRSEAEALAQLQHPQIVQVFEVGSHDGLPFLAIEYLEGGSLASRLAGRPLPPRQAAELAEQLARAVQRAHDREVLHRDLKPANVLFTGDGIAKIADFGLAKRADTGMTASGAVLGTPSYMAPEQAAGGSRLVGPAGDIYGLGAIFYECLTGRPPFQGPSSLETLEQVRTQDPVPPSRLAPRTPRDLTTICLKCLQKEPDRRYPTATALADDLRRFLEGRPIWARPVGGSERLWRWCRRNPGLAAASGLAVAAILAAATLAIGFGLAERKHAQKLEHALTEAKAQRQRATELAASATFDRGISLCEQGERARGLFALVESLRLIEDPAAELANSPLAQTTRATIGDWMRRSYELVGFLQHERPVLASAISADGQLAATASRDRTARLWSTADGRLIAAFQHAAEVVDVQFVAGSHTLLSVAGNDAMLWDPSSTAPLHSFGHSSRVQAAAVDAGGRRIVVAGADGMAQVYELATGTKVGNAIRHRGPIVLARFLPPDGRLLLTASDDQTARFWFAETGQPTGIPIELADAPACVAASPDGRWVVIGWRDGSARLCDAKSGRAVGSLLRHDAKVNAAVFRSDGRLLITASRDWNVRLWEVGETGIVGEPRRLRQPSPVNALALSGDDKWLVVGCNNGQALVSELASQKVAHFLPHLGDVDHVAISRDGRSVVSSGQETWARLWRMPPPPAREIKLPKDDLVCAMAFNSDRTELATADYEGVARIWDAATGRKLGEVHHGAGDNIWGVAYLPGGQSLVTVSNLRSAIIWDRSTLRPRRQFDHSEQLNSVAVSPDGRLLLTGARDGSVTLREIESGQKRCERRLHAAPVFVVSFSPDGKSFASASMDHTAILGRTNALEPMAPPLRHQRIVWVAAFSPDGRVLLTGGDDELIRLWDAATGRPIGPTMDHAAAFRLAVFAPDGRHVLIGSEGGTSRFWDLASHKPCGAPLHASGWVHAARFDPTTGDALTANEGVSIQQHRLPAPVEGDAETIAARVQAMTGLGLERGGGTLVLDMAGWRHAKARSGSTAAGGMVKTEP
jgi:WD40 repeat protein/tRNA A-37 threonylcarbamoyl transferase component Bud32